MARRMTQSAEQIGYQAAIHFNLTESENGSASLILTTRRDSDETPIGDYKLPEAYAEYAEILTPEYGPAALLKQMTAEISDQVKDQPLPIVLAGSARIMYPGTDFRLADYTNGSVEYIQLERPYNEAPPIVLETDRTFEALTQNFYTQGVTAILKDDYPWLDPANVGPVSGPGRLVAERIDAIEDYDSNRFYQIKLAQEPEDWSSTQAPWYVTLSATYLEDGQLRSNEIPVVECADAVQASQYRRYLNGDLQQATAATVTLCQHMHEQHFGDPEQGVHPTDYLAEHQQVEQYKTIVRRSTSEQNLSAAQTGGPNRYEVLTVDTNDGEQDVLLVHRQANAFNLQILDKSLNTADSETRCREYTELLHSPAGAGAVLDARTTASLLPISPDTYVHEPLPLDQPESDHWRPLNGSWVLPHISDGELKIELLAAQRHADGSRNQQTVSLGSWEEVGDLGSDLRFSHGENWHEALRQAQAIAAQPLPILDDYLASQPLPELPRMAALDSHNVPYLIERGSDTDSGKTYLQLAKYLPEMDVPAYTVQLPDAPLDNDLLYQKILFTQGPGAVLDLIDPDRTIERTPWPDEAINGRHLPFNSEKEWASDDDGKSWKQATHHRPADRQPGHQVVLRETSLNEDGIPTIQEQNINRYLFRAEAELHAAEFNKEPDHTMDPLDQLSSSNDINFDL